MLIFAHRGAASHGRQENTIAAFASALEAGAQLETDARLSGDGRVVLVHDAVVRRWPMLHVVRCRSAAQLAAIGVPTIDDVYAELGSDFQLSVDLKVPSAGAALIDAAHRASATTTLWLVSDRRDVLARLRASSAEVRLVHESRADRIGDPTTHTDSLAAASIDAQNTDVFGWDAAAIAHSHARGVMAFGSLANDVPRFDRARDLGIDAIYTDRLELIGAGR